VAIIPEKEKNKCGDVRPARQAGSGCAAQPRKEVHNKMQPTLGAELPAQGYVPAACEPTS